MYMSIGRDRHFAMYAVVCTIYLQFISCFLWPVISHSIFLLVYQNVHDISQEACPTTYVDNEYDMVIMVIVGAV